MDHWPRQSLSSIAKCVLALAILVAGCASPASDTDWVRAFGYTAADVLPIDLRDFGFPYVPVSIAGTRCMLPFDTGNMVGVSVSTGLFDEIGLRTDGSWSRLNSAGDTVASLRLAHAVDVSALGRDLGAIRVYELDNPSLPGLIGPTILTGGHFTLDYQARKIALSATRLPDTIPGFRKIPLVRSSRHPMLVIVRGTIEGRAVLIELDTGKSRTVINPTLASELALKRVAQGVTIRNLRIGDLSFEVPDAKIVDQSGIDPTLSEPILVGVGSDLLSRFVWTVDYDEGAVWVPLP